MARRSKTPNVGLWPAALVASFRPPCRSDRARSCAGLDFKSRAFSSGIDLVVDMNRSHKLRPLHAKGVRDGVGREGGDCILHAHLEDMSGCQEKVSLKLGNCDVVTHGSRRMASSAGEPAPAASNAFTWSAQARRSEKVPQCTKLRGLKILPTSREPA